MASGAGARVIYTRIGDIVDAFEDRLADSPYSLKVMDRLLLPGATADGYASPGVSVIAPDTANTDEDRDQDFARVRDTVAVTLTYKVLPKEQRVSRRQAYLLEEQIRHWLVDRVWLADLHITYAGSVRGFGPTGAEWIVIVQTFTLSRDAALGG